ncbi:hypothetical protein Ancab_026663 [Ancistrocladus abbreviatus]
MPELAYICSRKKLKKEATKSLVSLKQIDNKFSNSPPLNLDQHVIAMLSCETLGENSHELEQVGVAFNNSLMNKLSRNEAEELIHWADQRLKAVETSIGGLEKELELPA